MSEGRYLAENDNYYADQYYQEQCLSGKDQLSNRKNRNMVCARKEYKCDKCGGNISVGEKYWRLNINYVGVFHYCKKCIKK